MKKMNNPPSLSKKYTKNTQKKRDKYTKKDKDSPNNNENKQRKKLKQNIEIQS